MKTKSPLAPLAIQNPYHASAETMRLALRAIRAAGGSDSASMRARAQAAGEAMYEGSMHLFELLEWASMGV